MASKTGKQIDTIHKLPNISRSKDGQTMKCDQLIEYNARNIFLKKHAENEEVRLSSRRLFTF